MKTVMDRKRSIGEASRELGVQEHVLRFWEKEFQGFIQPTIGSGGRRYYYNDDINILLIIKEYLYEKGFTIKGLNNLLKNNEIDLRQKKVFAVASHNSDVTNNVASRNTEKSSFDDEIRQDLKKLKVKMADFYNMLKRV
jgi:DNA-binding transcriptional MerR regulator